MRPVRISIAGLSGVVVFFAVVFAGLRSGSNDAFKTAYSLTFVALVWATIAARFRVAFWYGFAVAGWAYFVAGFGPWIGSPPGSEPLRAVNRNLVTSVLLEISSDTWSRGDPLPAAAAGRAGVMMRDVRKANRDGVGHCALTALFACAGGLAAAALARRPATPPP